MKEVRELLCEICDRQYPCWSAPSLLWNEVMRDGDRGKPDRWSFVCPLCFATLAEQIRGREMLWTFSETGEYEHLLQAEVYEWRERAAKAEGRAA